MSHSSAPTDSDVQTFVTKAGVALPAGFAFDGLAAAAVAEFQRRTGQVPFILDSVDVARYYDPPGARSSSDRTVLELDAGLLTCVSVSVGVSADDPSGQPLDLQRQLRLCPLNAPALGQPYTWIEFPFPLFGAPSSVKIVGRWGYSSTWPDDAWQAVLRLGAWMAAQDVQQGIATRGTTLKEGDESVAFSDEALKNLGASWQSYVDRVVGRYRLVRLGS